MTNNEIIDSILEKEGGFTNDPVDRGGATNFGITQKVLSEYRGLPATVDDVKNLSIDEARQIYLRNYITAPKLDSIPNDSVRHLLVDSAVNHGPGTAIKWLQIAIGAVPIDGIIGRNTLSCYPSSDEEWYKVYNKVLASRISYYVNIVLSRVDQIKFLRGWINRCLSFLNNSR